MKYVALVLAALSLPATSFACSCMEPGATFFLQPQDGATGVPVNALVWVGAAQTRGLFAGEDQLAIELLDGDEVVLPGTEGRLRSVNDTIDVFTPDLLLEADTTYTVRVGEQVISTFTTGSEVDDEAPAVPEEVHRSSWSDPAEPFATSSCGPLPASHGVSLEWEMDGDTVLVLLDRDELADVEGLSGTVPALAPFGSATLGNGFVCGGDNWDDARHLASTDVRYGSFDLAGNFSGWSATEEVTVYNRAGCSAAGDTTPTALLVLLGLLGVVGVRRR